MERKRSYAEVLIQVTNSIVPKSKHTTASIASFWVKKESEVLNLNLKSLFVVSRLFAHYSWKEVKESLEEFLQTQISLNPFMEDKALLKARNDSILCKNVGRWKLFGKLYSKVDAWSNRAYS